MTLHFYRCATCGNVIFKFVDGGPVPVCCGHEMVELVPNKVDGPHEKHLPVLRPGAMGSVEVSVGSSPHPMESGHHICFICLHTDKGILVQWLEPGQQPTAVFYPGDAEPLAAYEYCNLHGLWKTSLC